MQSTTEQTGFSAVIGNAQGGVERVGGAVVAGGAETARVCDLPIRRLPVVPAHLSMAAARKVALLKQVSLLLVEREDHIVGTINEHALAVDHDLTAVAAAMRPLATYLRPAMSVTEARELFIRARAVILPVIAGGFILGAVTRSEVERARL